MNTADAHSAHADYSLRSLIPDASEAEAQLASGGSLPHPGAPQSPAAPSLVRALFSPTPALEGTAHAVNGMRWLCFVLADQLYALDVVMVQEVVRVPDIAPVAGSSPETIGVMNLRGQIVPVMDLRLRLALGVGKSSPAQRVVVLEHAGATLGILVDAVAEVFVANPDSVQETNLLSGSVPTVWFRGVLRRHKDLVVALDAVRLLTQQN